MRRRISIELPDELGVLTDEQVSIIARLLSSARVVEDPVEEAPEDEVVINEHWADAVLARLGRAS